MLREFIPAIEFRYVDEASGAIDREQERIASLARQVAMQRWESRRRTVLPSRMYALEVH